MLTTPRVEMRLEQPYLAIRTSVTLQAFGAAIPKLTGEVLAWMAARGIEPAGPSLVRFRVIDMARELDLDIGVLLAAPQAGDERVQAGSVPAGRYAVLTYTGVDQGMEGNRALLEWCAQQGLKLDQWHTDKGDAFGGRFEFLLTNPDVEPDMARWETEVCFRLADSA